MNRERVILNEEQIQKLITGLEDMVRDLRQKVNQLETNRDEVLDLIYSNVVSNGEVIDQLRKIEVKKLIEILERGKE